MHTHCTCTTLKLKHARSENQNRHNKENAKGAWKDSTRSVSIRRLCASDPLSSAEVTPGSLLACSTPINVPNQLTQLQIKSSWLLCITKKKKPEMSTQLQTVSVLLVTNKCFCTWVISYICARRAFVDEKCLYKDGSHIWKRTWTKNSVQVHSCARCSDWVWKRESNTLTKKESERTYESFLRYFILQKYLFIHEKF